ncbi:MAG: ABC transporter ATP-binding protein [Cyclobacteriaceae bacterium]|nr:ABC transporter ATP-binding protein [Cyclobacteriaceae bacterium]MDW8331428.1 ABC transporter ATP-binding protein [Cyclobacteriaceae bacterium]
MPENVLELRQVTKTFHSGADTLTVLHDITFSVESGDTLSLVGPSGSGKTTLLGLCAGLDLPTTGTIELAGHILNRLSEDKRAFLRNKYVGFVFQNFQLLGSLTALENVMIPLELRREANAEVRAKELLERVGLGNRLHHYPAQLSGGEQQRVAVARAFITRPAVLFADEPTGNLDEENAARLTDLLFSLNREQGTTLILVTHNAELAAKTGRTIQLRGGKILTDSKVASVKTP